MNLAGKIATCYASNYLKRMRRIWLEHFEKNDKVTFVVIQKHIGDALGLRQDL